MDKLTKHKKIVRTLIEEIAEMTPPDENTETQTIMDEVRGYYLLFDVGFENIRHVFLPWVHLEVKKNGKIWLHHDGTDLKIALILNERGISKKDIVLAFHTPERRKLMPEFAFE